MPSLNHDEARRRTLAMLFILDASGSMASRGKIDSLNLAMGDLGVACRELQARNPEIDILLQAVSFSDASATSVLADWTSPDKFKWNPLSACGGTPMGAGFTEGQRQFALLPKNTVYLQSVAVLLSDGYAGDEWEVPLGSFLASPHGRKANKFSVAVGADADRDCLGRFCEGSENGILEASNASMLVDAIVFNTMEASQEAISGKSVLSGGSLPSGSRHSVINGDLPVESLNDSIVDSASRENNLW